MYDLPPMSDKDKANIDRLEAAGISGRLWKTTGSAMGMACVSVIFNPCGIVTLLVIVSALGNLGTIVLMNNDARPFVGMQLQVVTAGVSLLAVVLSLVGSVLISF